VAELATERLLLRPVVREDIPRIVALAGDSRVAETSRSLPHPLTVDLATGWLDGVTVRRNYAFAIVRKDDNGNPESALIGVVALTVAAVGGKAQIGYWLGHDYWGRGYMSAAVRRVVRFAFGDLKLAAIEADVLAGNERSIGALVGAGFDVEGRAMRPAPARGGEREVLVFHATRASFARAALSQAVGRE
jgi:RimJ/RimL family protein N-acetyltransferase